MIIRIFSFVEAPLEKYLNFLRLEQGARMAWKIEKCDPMTWMPTPGDIHIYVDIPVRLAVPWAKFNIFATDAVLDALAGDSLQKDRRCCGPSRRQRPSCFQVEAFVVS